MPAPRKPLRRPRPESALNLEARSTSVSPEPPQTANPLIGRVLSGEDPALARLAAEGLLPLPPEELLPVQVALAGGDDPEVARAAHKALHELPVERFAVVVAGGIGPDVLRWVARERRDPSLLEALVQRRDIPHELLAEVAMILPPKVQELLLVRQDAIVSHPEILDALAGNPALSTYSRRRIREYREHLVPAGGAHEEDEKDDPSDAEVAAAIEEARGKTPSTHRTGSAEVEESTGLSSAQIRTLPVPVRRKLARTTSSKSMRDTLIRDPNPQVALAAFSGAHMTEGDVEKLAGNRSVAGEVLEEIARRRDWANKYKVIAALVHNPRTPPGVAVRLLSRVSVRELGILARDHNISQAVRSNAQRLYRMKRR